MRITGGRLGGRRLASPSGRVRPTQDRVRLALFSCLAEQVPGARVLDLFAGTGALGLEALSRGATWACWVERDPRVCAALRRTLEDLACGPDQGRVVADDVFRFLRRPWAEPPFDLVLADPPYDREGSLDWPGRLRHELGRAPLLNPGGILVIETLSARAGPDQDDGWCLLRRKAYGMTGLDIWQKNG
jgi:16S rRNA (guanine966-N2)-methyltransferase